VLDDGGNEVSEEIFGGPNSNYGEVMVLRSAGMEEVARRLGMLLLKNM